MLPAHIYEPLPYAYLGVALASTTASGFNGMVVVCSLILASASALILKMRRDYRRQLRRVGLTSRSRARG